MLHIIAWVALALPSWSAQDSSAADRDARTTPEVKVVRRASPAVVYIEATRPLAYFDAFAGMQTRRGVVSGSGVVIEKSGYIVTNSHVIAGADTIKVQFGSDANAADSIYDADLVGEDASEDLALLKIRGNADFPVVAMGTSSDLMIGERVVVIGNPFHQRLSVSSGIISGLHRNIPIDAELNFPDLIQTDASINPGNSGGPVLNILGEMIGIATVVNQQAENMGYAIPVDRVKEVLEDELLAPKSAKSYLGFDTKDDGLRVERVTPNGPAFDAGVKEGDRIVALNGEKVGDAKEFNLKRLPLRANAPIRLTLARNERTFEVAIKGWNKADGILYERMGLMVDHIAVGQGVFVSVRSVCPGGPAEQLGLKPEDVIISLREGEKQPVYVASARTLASWISTLKPGTQLALELLRDENKDKKLSMSEERYKGVLTLR